jgi:hypothetical protein
LHWLRARSRCISSNACGSRGRLTAPSALKSGVGVEAGAFLTLRYGLPKASAWVGLALVAAKQGDALGGGCSAVRIAPKNRGGVEGRLKWELTGG